MFPPIHLLPPPPPPHPLPPPFPLFFLEHAESCLHRTLHFQNRQQRRLGIVGGADTSEPSNEPFDEPSTAAGSRDGNAAARGGALQRYRASASSSRISDGENAASSNSAPPDAPFNRELKIQWARNQITSAQVQKLAMAALEQGLRGSESLARIGASGHHAGNFHRALVNIFGYPQNAADIRFLEIPTLSGTKTPHPFLMPLDFFKRLQQSASDSFLRAVLFGSPGCALRFWQRIRHTSFVRMHPLLDANRFDMTIPIGLHADAGAFNKQESIYVIAWNSLLGDAPTLQKRFLFTLIKKSSMITETMDAILNIFAEQMNILAQAHHHNTLCGYSGVLCQIRGDWAFYCETFRFPQWNSAERMCWCCRASSVDEELLWTDTARNSGWRSTKFNHESYLEYMRLHNLIIPILLAVCIGLRLECVTIDVLHVVDLGIYSHISANIIWHFFVRRRVMGGSTQHEAIARAWTHLTNWYKEHNITSRLQNKLTVDRLRSTSGFPKLKAKGAQCRHLAPWIYLLCQMYGGDTDDEKLMTAVALGMFRFYDILDTCGDDLPPQVIIELREIGHTVARSYEVLCAMFHQAGEKMFKMVPKLHLFEHLVEDQVAYWGNPRTWWTYSDEDLVGLVIDMARGTHPSTMAHVMLYKWLLIQFDSDLHTHGP